MRKKTTIIKNSGNIGNLVIQSISIRRLIGGNKGITGLEVILSNIE